ncbi:PEP-CTERM sorting domain-containing protein [Anabaena minutissima FACHB-250]|nr:PEP-CTERM sorting domain-containing protein [Anabaena minutissima FACHB-250]
MMYTEQIRKTQFPINTVLIAISSTALISLVTMSATQAATVTLTFDELPTQPVDGLSFKGVTFDFKINGVNSTDAFYNLLGPEGTVFISDNSLNGLARGVLTLDFEQSISALSFGVALNRFTNFTPGFTVELFDPKLTSLGITPVNTSSLVSFTEGLFSYSGEPVRRAVVNFNNEDAFAFSLDNLTYQPISTAVPEPMTILGSLAVGALALASRRKQHEKKYINNKA